MALKKGIIMKKVISLLLAFVLMISMCACGSKELSAEEKQEVYQEVMAEKIVNAMDGTSLANAMDGTSAKEENKMNDTIQIEGVKIEQMDRSQILYSVKIRNMYKAETVEQPNRIMLEFQALDKAGDVLETGYFIYEGLDYEQGGWAITSIHSSFDDIGAIRFISYIFQYDTKDMNAPGTMVGLKMLGGGVFTEPVTVPVEDFEIEVAAEKAEAENADSEIVEEENSKNQYDIVVEDCAVAWDGKGYVAIKPKVHNYTDMDAQFLGLNCELINKDGRTMRVTLCDTGGIAAGANEWVSGTMQIKDDEISALAEIKFSGGGFDVLKDGMCLRQTVRFAETSFTKEHVFGE